MIKFVMVNPKIDLDSYLEEIVEKLNSDKKIVKKCNAYDKADMQYKLKLDTFNEKIYFIDLELATYNNSKHLFVSINPQKVIGEFDKELYTIKFFVKDSIIRDWEECIWLLDEQSSNYAIELYSEIHKVENKLRQFINIVMIRNFGINWWENYAPLKIKEKYKVRQAAYKRVAEQYRNVNDKLLSIDTDDLITIMTHKIKKFKGENGSLVVKLLESLKEVGDICTVAAEYNRLVIKLKNECEVEFDIWESIFNKYFSEEFIKKWDNFSKNRNHVAHNKLLDTNAYIKIKNSIEVVKEAINNAESKFIESSLSDEEKEMILELEAMREMELEMQRISRMEEEAGIRILDADTIFEKFEESVTQFIEHIEDTIYFRDDLDTSSNPLKKDSPTNELLFIKSRLNENELKVTATMFLDDNEGGESSLKMKLIVNGEVYEECEMSYRNGEAALDPEQNYYLPVQYNEFYDEELDNFLSLIEKTIEEEFPNLIEEVAYAKSSAIRDGGKYPVAEFPCEECGEQYVCIDENIEEIGKCVNCGHQHSVNQCERCESFYNDALEGDSMFCESCLDWFRSQ